MYGIYALFLITCLVLPTITATYPQQTYPVRARHVPQELLDDTLGWVGKDPVIVGDFLSLYEKSFLGDSVDYSRKSLQAYWNLYIQFRRKLLEARRLGIDTEARVREEISRYTRQMARRYVYNKAAIDSALTEAYLHRQKEVFLSIIQMKATPPVRDSVLKLLSHVKSQIQKGKLRFEKAVQTYSIDERSKQNNGKTGWFTFPTLPYKVERLVMNASPGDVVGPVIVKNKAYLIRVDSIRKARGEVLTAHIFFRVSNWDDSQLVKAVKKRIEEVYRDLQTHPFDEVARKYSEDTRTASRGGKYRWFGPGETHPEYERAAFSLPPGQYTPKPVKTNNGYFIIRVLARKDSVSFEEFREKYEATVRRDRDRMKAAAERVLKHLRKRYGIKVYTRNVEWFIRKYSGQLAENTALNEQICRKGRRKKLISIPDQNKRRNVYRIQDLCKYVQGKTVLGRQPEEWLRNQWNRFLEDITINFLANRLGELDPDYGRLAQEYANGIILFEVMNRKVWDPAVKDTLKLREFYLKNKTIKGWDSVLEAVLFYVPANDKKLRQLVEKTLSIIRGIGVDSAISYVKRESRGLIIVQRGPMLKDQHPILQKIDIEKGIAGPVEAGQNYVVYAYLMGKRPAKLEDIKARVITEYQNYLEKEWMKVAEKLYPARLNENVFEKLVKE